MKLLKDTSRGRLLALKVPPILASPATFFSSLFTRCFRSSCEILNWVYLVGSFSPINWNPKFTRCCSGWILQSDQCAITKAPLIWWFFISRSISPRRKLTWSMFPPLEFQLSFFTSGPADLRGRGDWLWMLNHIYFQSMTLSLNW